jgi:alkylation response protein AidB-like acyl-CoA dehydrogenase
VSGQSDLAQQVQAWVDRNWDQSMTLREWWRRLAEVGYSYPSWPTGLGGLGAPPLEARVVLGVLARNGVVGPPVGAVAARLAAPTILEHGSEALIERLVRPIALGEAAWCQLFSEPGSGSDLASVGTKAERDGEEWTVTGQKVWSSSADQADFGMLLARTDPDQPKHRGITFFALDMHQPGVEVRPLRQMNGFSSFCEVFLNRARVRHDHIVGALNEGWRAVQSTLFHERSSVAGGGFPGLVSARSGQAGDLERTVGEVVRQARQPADSRSPVRSGAVPVKVMLQLSCDHGVDQDVHTRQELARYVSQVRINGWTMRRIAAARGHLTGADGSVAKLTTSRICQVSRDLSYRIAGPAAMLAGPESPLGGDLQMVGLASPGTRIGGGADEIQLNVLGEKALGLSREPAVDRDIPYRDLSVGTQRPGH